MRIKTKLGVGIKLIGDLINTRHAQQGLHRVRVMATECGAPNQDGRKGPVWKGWLDGTFDHLRPGERVHQLTLTLWVYTKPKPRKRRKRKTLEMLQREVDRKRAKFK
jgi:hypothetical protein